MLWKSKNGSVKIDDTKMCYASFGRGKKTFVVLPGLSDGLATVKGKALLLALPYKKFFDDYTVYMFSRKNKMPEDYSIRDMAHDTARALEILGIEKISLMGVSQGGMISEFMAADYPNLVEKLVLVVTAPYANEMIKTSVGSWICFAENGDHKKLMIDTAEKYYSEKYLEKYRALYPIVSRLGKPKSYERFFINARAILNFNASDEIEKIKCPTFIICGKKDRVVGIQASYELHEKIAESKIFIYEEFGHAPFEESKDFYDKILDFLQE